MQRITVLKMMPIHGPLLLVQFGKAFCMVLSYFFPYFAFVSVIQQSQHFITPLSIKQPSSSFKSKILYLQHTSLLINNDTSFLTVLLL